MGRRVFALKENEMFLSMSSLSRSISAVYRNNPSKSAFLVFLWVSCSREALSYKKSPWAFPESSASALDKKQGLFRSER